MVRLLRGLNESDWQLELQQIDPRITLSDISGYLQPGTLFVKITAFPSSLIEVVQSLLVRHCGAILVRGADGDTSVRFIFALPALRQRNFLEQLSGAGESVLQELGARCSRLLENARKRRWHFQSRGVSIPIDKPVIMGVLNVTPDSFSDGGRYLDPEAAYRRALEMREQGAEWIDIGGESTRPGSAAVPLEEEWRRIEPVITRLSRERDIILSVDTYKSEIARRALESGAHMVNDISGFSFDARMRQVVARYGVPAVLMHIKGTPRDMQNNPRYTNLMDELYGFLEQRIQYARDGGVEQIIIDPGIGFGKRWEDNFEILRRLGEFSSLGYPVLVGTSRKSFIGRLLDVAPEERVVGTMASIAAAYRAGARIFRVHDVVETRQTLQVLEGISQNKAM